MNASGRVLIFLCTLAATASLAMAHPMGNFSINHYALIIPSAGAHDAKSVEVLYVLDLAELPTFELLQRWRVDGDSAPGDLERSAQAEAQELARNLQFRENGVLVTPKLGRTDYVMADGAGGLPVLRINAHFKLPGRPGRFEYVDRNFAERAGWKEVVIEGRRGTEVTHARPGGADRSRALTAYPQDPALAPPQDVTAEFDWRVAAPMLTESIPIPVSKQPDASVTRAPVTGPAPPEARSLGTIRRDDYLSRTLKSSKTYLPWGVALLCVCVAFGVGALHAVEPGHGKTMVAAYLVGSRGTYQQAMFLGGMVTFTHTVSVFLLGLITLFLSQYILPAVLVPVMGVISGVSIIWIGGLLLYRRGRRLLGHKKQHVHHHHHDGEHTHAHYSHDQAHAHIPHHHHHHDHTHAHHHHDHGHVHTHTHGGVTHTHVPADDVTLGSLVTLGISGGLVPCPAALVLLLSCISIGRPGFGLVLLLSFSLGLALVLMLIGMIVLAVKNTINRNAVVDRPGAWARYLPVGSAALILGIGIYMTGIAVGLLPTVRVIG